MPTPFFSGVLRSCAPPPCSTSASLARTLAPAHLALASAVTFTVDHTSFLSPCCTASSPPFSLCPPPARLTRLPPHTPAAHPAYTLHLALAASSPLPRGKPRNHLLHRRTPPVTVIAQCSHCTLQSPPPVYPPTSQLSNFPTNREVDKSTSRQVGKHPLNLLTPPFLARPQALSLPAHAF